MSPSRGQNLRVGEPDRSIYRMGPFNRERNRKHHEGNSRHSEGYLVFSKIGASDPLEKFNLVININIFCRRILMLVA